MHISEIFNHVGCEGLTNDDPPQVLSIDPVRVSRVFDRKAGENNFGEWSFQDCGLIVDGEKHYVKLENLPPAADLGIREGLTVTFASVKNAKGAYKGVKVKSEERNGATQTRVYITPNALIKAGAKVLYGEAPKSAASDSPAPKAHAKPAQKAKPAPPPPEEEPLTDDQQAYLEANPDDPKLIGYREGWQEPEAPEAAPQAEEGGPRADHEAGAYQEAGRRIGLVLKALFEEAGVSMVDVSVMTDAEPARLAAIAHQQGELYRLASTAFISASGGRR